MTTIPSDVYQGAGGLSEEEKTDLVPATAGEVAKYFNAVPAQNKRLRGHDVSRRSTPGDPTNEDTRVLMAFLKAIRDALFTGEWADPNTLELASNGKIRVKDVFVGGDRYPAVNNGNAFYLVDNIPAIVAAMLKAGGGLATDSNGKMYVDFSLMDPSILQAVVYAMVQQGGGLSVDDNGQLYVDFDSMPTGKFEALLKSLKMLIPLTANLTLYVDKNSAAAGDTIVDGRGTEAKPFKTIQACVDYATGTYAVGNYNCIIRVKAGTYGENVRLPEFSRGTGHMTVTTDSTAQDVTVVAQVLNSGTVGTCFRATGGDWRIYYIKAQRTEGATTSKGQALSCFAADDGATLHLYGCSAVSSLPTAGTSVGGESYEVRLLSADNGGTIHLHHWKNSVEAEITTEKPSSGVPTVYVFSALRRGSIWLYREYDDADSTGQFTCSGSCDAFVRLRNGGSVTEYSSGTIIGFDDTDSPVTGAPYKLTGGSFVSIGEDTGHFPGDGTANVESATYCWYA